MSGRLKLWFPTAASVVSFGTGIGWFLTLRDPQFFGGVSPLVAMVLFLVVVISCCIIVGLTLFEAGFAREHKAGRAP